MTSETFATAVEVADGCQTIFSSRPLTYADVRFLFRRIRTFSSLFDPPLCFLSIGLIRFNVAAHMYRMFKHASAVMYICPIADFPTLFAHAGREEQSVNTHA